MTEIIITLFCSLSFLGYGISCLTSKYMEREFVRFELKGYQRITGILQISGAIGLLVGIYLPVIGLLAALGLAIQMLLGVIVRIKIRDGFARSLPAFLYMCANVYLVGAHFA